MLRKILLILIVVMTTLYSCSLAASVIDRDDEKANKTIEAVLNTIQAKDKDKLKSLFSQNALQKAESLDKSIDDLFEYFDGEVKSYDDGAGPFVATEQENDYIYQLMESSFTVITDNCEYCFAMQFITKGNESELGLTSLYIIKSNDYSKSEATYWGDSLFTPGIHINKQNETP